MTFAPSATRLRPRTFESVVGQDVAVRILRNSIQMSRVSTSYIFSGPPGTGKTTLARVFAAALNCEFPSSPTMPCATCDRCADVFAGKSDYVTEIDAASDRSVEMVDALQEAVRVIVHASAWRVFVLDEAHQLSAKAWGALLKTIEEPPPRVTFLFVTTEPWKIPDTISGRSLSLQVRPVPEDAVLAALAEHFPGMQQAARALVARSSGGSVRDAYHLVDKIALLGDAPLAEIEEALGLDMEAVKDVADALVSRDFNYFMGVVDGLCARGKTPYEVGRLVLDVSRDLYVARVGHDGPTRSGLPAEALRRNSASIPETYVQCLFQTAVDYGVTGLIETRAGIEALMVKALHA